ncbi:MAG: TfoX/Sxy family protein [Flavisolibacter sp.]
MAYNEKLANRIREHLAHLPRINEKEMMGGIAFMYNDKMCVGVVKDELMCRIDPEVYESIIENNGCRPMDFTGKPMKGWIFVEENSIRSNKELEYWLHLAIQFNKKAKKSKRK